jgi:hypothetical protein
MNIIDSKPIETTFSFSEDSDGDSSTSDYSINPLNSHFSKKGGNELKCTFGTSSDFANKRAHGSTSPRHSTTSVMNDIVDNLLTQPASDSSKQIAGKCQPAKMTKISKIFTKKTTASSHFSTSASEDSSSCERSTPMGSGKQSRSSSFEEEQIVVKNVQRYTRPAKVPFNTPTQNPMVLLQCMMNAAIMGDNQYAPQQSAPVPVVEADKVNVKKAVPNKFKTEMCRNWVNHGFCKFATNCTYAHGDFELHKKPSLPSNLHSKFCKAFNQEPFVCPKGQDCTLLHLKLTSEDPDSLQKMKLKAECKYSLKLAETLSHMEKRLRQLKDFEQLDLTSGIVVSRRLDVFESIAQSDDVDSTSTNDSTSTPPLKKTTLKLKSRVFVMPKKAESSAAQPPFKGEQGVSTAPTFINRVSDFGKAQ